MNQGSYNHGELNKQFLFTHDKMGEVFLVNEVNALSSYDSKSDCKTISPSSPAMRDTRPRTLNETTQRNEWLTAMNNKYNQGCQTDKSHDLCNDNHPSSNDNDDLVAKETLTSSEEAEKERMDNEKRNP